MLSNPRNARSGLLRSANNSASRALGGALLTGPGGRTASIVALAAVFLWGTALPIASQTAGNSGLREYSNAVAQTQTGDRISGLQRFAWTASGPLRSDALAFIVWEYLRINDHAHAVTWARELQNADHENALAVAVICEDAQSSANSAMSSGELLSTATNGENALPRLRRPMGMSDADFARLRRLTVIMLKRAAGHAELQRKDYVSARTDLRQVVGLDPNSAQSVYLLALADLSGKDPNLTQGYSELARAVTLSRGTPQGDQIAQYARTRYVKDGGSNAAWDQFLHVAGLANTTPNVTTRTASAASISPKAAPAKTSPMVKASKPGTGSESPHSNTKQSVWADNTTPAPPIVRKPLASNGPMSLGILIETSLTTKETRGAVRNSLTDMLRRMNEKDEAFILTYDNHMVFEQDLTDDPKQLEQAIEDIKPRKGAALDDAVAFAAEHLTRIAKNPNRVLLVISDGRNVGSHSSPLQTSSRINAAGVRIYCIGIAVDQLDGRYRLQALSSGTGGRSDFISDPSQFRNATKQIAQNMGIDFRF